jgi:hypothetical protein
MNRPNLIAAMLLTGLVACEGEAVDQMLLPADVTLEWDASFNAEDDGLGALVPVDVMVYEAESGEPVAGVPITLDAGELASILTPDDVWVVDPDVVDNSWCEACIWDGYLDQYMELDGAEGADAVALHTDADGVARAYVYVDSFPRDASGFTSVPVVVTADMAEEAFFLIPQ